MLTLEKTAVISGIGMSETGRRLGIDPWLLTTRAALAAIADAGLSPDDIDGISTYPGAQGSTPGMSGAGVDDIRNLLGLKTRWHTGGSELPGQLGSVVNAIAAVATGLANHVLCFRTVWESTAQEQAGGDRSKLLQSGTVREYKQWTDPYGAGYPTRGALWMQRYMHETGATRSQIGQIAVTCRTHAGLNPGAVYRKPMTIEEYLDARMISDPLCLYDCDVPMDGSIAFVVSRADSDGIDRARSLAIEAVGSATGFEEASQMMWSRTSLKPEDVRLAEIYDGFSPLAIMWLEALGITGGMTAARFIDGGENIALTGRLPFNTAGGQLSAGRMHGYGHLHQACRQLRGEAEASQIERVPGVAVVTSGAPSFSSSILLSGG